MTKYRSNSLKIIFFKKGFYEHLDQTTPDKNYLIF